MDNSEKTSLMLGILSWIMTIVAFAVLAAIRLLVPVGELKTKESVIVWAVVAASSFVGLLFAGMVLAVISRGRSRRLHGERLAVHGTIGLVVNLSLIVGYAVCFGLVPLL